MAELTVKERLQPSLLDRLTDDEPEKNVESRDRRVISLERLRDCVLRDLGWLLNTGRLSQVQDLDAYPEVARSVVNYGSIDLSGRHLSSTDLAELESAVKQAILEFEPRILPRHASRAIGPRRREDELQRHHLHDRRQPLGPASAHADVSPHRG